MEVSRRAKVRHYCEWAGVTKLEEFFQQAAEYVLSKDRSWISHASKAPAVADPDRKTPMPLLINDVPISCINHAVVAYHIPAPVILSILHLEDGRNGDARLNRNGTTDYGVFQINSVWHETLRRHGYSRQDLQFNPCRNVEAAAWILSQNMARKLPVWTAIAGYHSMTPERNRRYAMKARKMFASLGA